MVQLLELGLVHGPCHLIGKGHGRYFLLTTSSSVFDVDLVYVNLGNFSVTPVVSVYDTSLPRYCSLGSLQLP